MTFDEILDQAIEMLQRRGRLTYRALQRQFDLDDAYLEDLKDELIEGQRLAADENGRVLVWIGEAGAPRTWTKSAMNASRWSLRTSLMGRQSGRSSPTMAMKARLRSLAKAILRLENTPTQ